MASKSAQFFENGTNKQFEFVLSKYQEALQAKADSKNSKSEILLKLDKWYQNELPKKIKSRGKEAHLTHEEMVQTIKWKLARGKFYPQLTNLVRINTPRAVQTESRKAFRKLPNVDAAVTTLCGLKGVGTTLASAVLAAGAPEVAPFMADECLLSMPEVEGIDYTMKEYMKLVEKTNQCVERLNAQGGSWNPHKVELAIWAYFVARDLKPELLDDMPDSRGNTYGVTEPAVKEVVPERVNGENGCNGEVSKNGDENEESKEGQTNGLAEVDDNLKSVHSLSPEPEAEPVGFTPEPLGFNYNGVGSASETNEASNGSFDPVEEISAEVPGQAENQERPFNGEPTKEVPLLENNSSCQASYPAYSYSSPIPMYSTPAPVSINHPDPPPPQHVPVPESLPGEDIPAPVPDPVGVPLYNKRPLDETEDATPDNKRVREEHIPTPETAEASTPEPSSYKTDELPVGGVVPVVPAAPTVTECPAQNGVISSPPQPIHTGGD